MDIGQSQTGETGIVEFVYSHIQQLYPAFFKMSLGGDFFRFFCKKLIILTDST